MCLFHNNKSHTESTESKMQLDIPPSSTFPSSSRGLKRLRKRGAGEAARRVVDNVVENSTKRAGPEVCSQYCSGETMPTAALFSPLYPTDSLLPPRNFRPWMKEKPRRRREKGERFARILNPGNNCREGWGECREKGSVWWKFSGWECKRKPVIPRDGRKMSGQIIIFAYRFDR